jgi:hypothetical protein
MYVLLVRLSSLLLQNQMRFRRETQGNVDFQPMLICNLHGSDIVNFYQVTRDVDILAANDCGMMAAEFNMDEWQSEQALWQSVSTRDGRQRRQRRGGERRGEEERRREEMR